MFLPRIFFQWCFWSQNIVFNISSLHRAYCYWFLRRLPMDDPMEWVQHHWGLPQLLLSKFSSCISLRALRQGCGWLSTMTSSPSDMGVALCKWRVLSCWRGAACTGGGVLLDGILAEKAQDQFIFLLQGFCRGFALVALCFWVAMLI